jgi:hypothetical protein
MKNSHLIVENSVLPAAVDVVETMFGKSYVKELCKIPSPDNIFERRLSEVSEDLGDQLTDQLKSSRFHCK